ncbi:MAG: NnrS family protein [bacterium]|nr:NnrS family protein [bacterium]
MKLSATTLSVLSPSHPLWLVGFRPFFTLVFLSGVFLPWYWVAVFSGWLHWDWGPFPPNRWHGHEMFYGFGWALLGGFLLTASKNWVKIRGLHGAGLILAVLLWFADRALMLLEPGYSLWGRAVGSLFLLYVIGYLLYSLIRFRSNDSFADNPLFWVALPMFLVAKQLMLTEDYFDQGLAMTIGLFRVAFVIMFERTMTQFMKNALNCPLPRRPWLDYGIKISMLLAVGSIFLPAMPAAILLLSTASLLLFRFLIWKPQVGMRNFGIGVMYLGYFGLVVHLGLEIVHRLEPSWGVGSYSLHMFTFFCMGLIIPAMMIRISQGHTGRKPVFRFWDKAALGLMLAGGLFRVLLTQIWPQAYLTWVVLAGVGWTSCFAILGIGYTPYLFQNRIDGKEH